MTDAPRLYTARDASQITGVGMGRLEHLCRSNAIRPRRDAEGRGDSRLYDFANLVEISAACSLLAQGVPVRVIRCAISFLSGLRFATAVQRAKENRAILVVTREEIAYSSAEDLARWCVKGNSAVIVNLRSLIQELEEKTGDTFNNDEQREFIERSMANA